MHNLSIWKWVLFACEWKLSSIWKAVYQDSLWKRGTNKNSEMAYCTAVFRVLGKFHLELQLCDKRKQTCGWVWMECKILSILGKMRYTVNYCTQNKFEGVLF